jgi:hypothetical protein
MRQPNSRIRSVGDFNERDREHFEVAKSFDGPFNRADFAERYSRLYPSRKDGSIIPSDYCFNKENKGNGLYPRFLRALRRGEYQFVGLHPTG